MALHPTICEGLFQRDRYHFSISPKALGAGYLKHPGMPNREIPLLQAECTPSLEKPRRNQPSEAPWRSLCVEKDTGRSSSHGPHDLADTMVQKRR
ncbi:hypothetical protein ACRRTK_003573 [Alexandromys fortis]